MAKNYREYECNCGHKWTSAVRLSSTTSNISGEATAFCPACERRAAYASSYTDPNDIELLRLADKQKENFEALGILKLSEGKMKEIPIDKTVFAVEWRTDSYSNYAVDMLFEDEQDARVFLEASRERNRGIEYRLNTHTIRRSGWEARWSKE